MQKYQHIIELLICILQIIVVIFLFPITVFLEYIQLQSYQIKLYYYHSQVNLKFDLVLFL